MKVVTVIHDAGHWQELADEVERQAEHMNDPEAKQHMRQSAEGYMKLVRHADRMARRRAHRGGS